MKKLILSGISIFAVMSSSAEAQDGKLYVGVDGFASFLGKEKSVGVPLELQNDFKTGTGFAGIVGYDFGQFRLEGEIGKHYHKPKNITVINDGGLGLVSGSAAGGKSNMTHYMANAVIDLESPLADIDIEPFIGAGLGVSNIAWNNMTTAGAALPYTHGSDNVFAYQAFAGFRVPISREVDISLKYRYLGSGDADRVDRLGGAFKSSYNSHDIVFGISYKFGVKEDTRAAKMPQPVTPAPQIVPDPTPVAEIAPSAPAPMPEANKGPYSIYFEWDSSFISSAAREVLRSAIIESDKVDQITIKVDGHADRSGPTGYNDNLSFERATAVREAMIANGVDVDKILIEGHGERMPEVATADGVRERHNRRVTIVLN